MSKISETIKKYSAGVLTLDEANKILAKLDYPALDPHRNTVTQYEKETTTVGYFPWQANGTGLLDTGTGTMDKVTIRMGHVQGFNAGGMDAFVIICGKMYKVEKDMLVDYAG